MHVCQLGNGTTVIMSPDPSQPEVALSVVYGVGAKDEGPHEIGMAHMLEHMLFAGSEIFPRPRDEIVGVGGETNAVTGSDSTRYITQLPAGNNHLHLALRIEADRMAGEALLTAQDLEIEKSVVRNEFDRHTGHAHGTLQRSIYGSAFQLHGYGRSVSGPRSAVAEIEPHTLRQFYRRYYRPDNATVIVTGSIDLDSTKRSIQETIAQVPPSREPALRGSVREPQQQGEREIVVRRPVASPVMGVLHHGLAATDPDYPALLALRSILTRAQRSRLHRALVNPGLATRIASASPSTADPGAFYIVVDVAPGTAPQTVQEILKRELEELATGSRPITDDEAQRFRETATEEPDASALRTASRLSAYVAAGDWRLAVAIPKASATVETTAINRVAQAVLKPSNRTIGVLLPTEAPDFTPWSAQAPSSDWIEPYLPGPSTPTPESPVVERFEFTIDNIERNVERSTPPTGPRLLTLVTPGWGSRVYANLILSIDDRDSNGSLGAAWSLAPELVTKSRGKDDALPLVDELARTQTELDISHGAGLLGISLATTPEHLAASLQRVIEVLREMHFSADDLEAARGSYLAAQQGRATEPSHVAIDRAFRSLSRGTRPLGLSQQIPTGEQTRGLAELSVDELEALYRRTLIARGAVLTVVGDFDPSSLRGAIDVDWGPSPPGPIVDSEAPLDTMPRDILEHIPGHDLGMVLLGQHVTMNDEQPDFPAIRAAMRILGGSAGSRLSRRLREQEGYSYESGASFNRVGPSGWGPLMIYATTSPENTIASLAAMREETARLVDGGVTAQELEGAKQALALAQTRLFSRPKAVCAMLSRAALRGRTLEYEQELSRQLQALTVAQVNDAIQRHIRPESMMSVIAADQTRVGTRAH